MPALRRLGTLKLAAVLMAALVAGLTLVPQGTAYAHPLGNFTINRYARLEVYRDAVQIHYVVDMAEIPTFQLIGDVDADGNGKVSTYAVSWWKLTTPDKGAWAYAGQSRPNLTLQTCVGAKSQYRLIVRLLKVS